MADEEFWQFYTAKKSFVGVLTATRTLQATLATMYMTKEETKFAIFTCRIIDCINNKDCYLFGY